MLRALPNYKMVMVVLVDPGELVDPVEQVDLAELVEMEKDTLLNAHATLANFQSSVQASRAQTPMKD